MGLLETIKSALGIGSSRDQEPDPGSERAVKEPVTSTTDAGGSTGSVPEEPAETPGDTEAADHASTDEEPTEPTAEVGSGTTPDAADETDSETDAGGESVEAISGIGPAYAERLAEAGIETVSDLKTADADAVAEQTGVSAKRVGRWIDAANEH